VMSVERPSVVVFWLLGRWRCFCGGGCVKGRLDPCGGLGGLVAVSGGVVTASLRLSSEVLRRGLCAV